MRRRGPRLPSRSDRRAPFWGLQISMRSRCVPAASSHARVLMPVCLARACVRARGDAVLRMQVHQ